MPESREPRRPVLDEGALHEKNLKDLTAKHPDIPPAEIELLYHTERQKLVQDAKTTKYVAVIAHKKTIEHLKARKKNPE